MEYFQRTSGGAVRQVLGVPQVPVIGTIAVFRFRKGLPYGLKLLRK
jgi:hypothetical protein